MTTTPSDCRSFLSAVCDIVTTAGAPRGTLLPHLYLPTHGMYDCAVKEMSDALRDRLHQMSPDEIIELMQHDYTNEVLGIKKRRLREAISNRLEGIPNDYLMTEMDREDMEMVDIVHKESYARRVEQTSMYFTLLTWMVEGVGDVIGRCASRQASMEPVIAKVLENGEEGERRGIVERDLRDARASCAHMALCNMCEAGLARCLGLSMDACSAFELQKEEEEEDTALRVVCSCPVRLAKVVEYTSRAVGAGQELGEGSLGPGSFSSCPPPPPPTEHVDMHGIKFCVAAVECAHHRCCVLTGSGRYSRKQLRMLRMALQYASAALEDLSPDEPCEGGLRMYLMRNLAPELLRACVQEAERSFNAIHRVNPTWSSTYDMDPRAVTEELLASLRLAWEFSSRLWIRCWFASVDTFLTATRVIPAIMTVGVMRYASEPRSANGSARACQWLADTAYLYLRSIALCSSAAASSAPSSAAAGGGTINVLHVRAMMSKACQRLCVPPKVEREAGGCVTATRSRAQGRVLSKKIAKLQADSCRFAAAACSNRCERCDRERTNADVFPRRCSDPRCLESLCAAAVTAAP